MSNVVNPSPPVIDYSRPARKRVLSAADVVIYVLWTLWTCFWLLLSVGNVVGRLAGGPRNPFGFRGALICLCLALLGIYGIFRRAKKQRPKKQHP